MLGWKRGTLSVFVYILLGAVGVPVFAGMSGGVGILAGPTGGYIIGFLATALIVGFAADKWERKALPLTIAMILGILVCYAFGSVWFMVVMKWGVVETLMTCVVPFLIPDALKIVLAMVLSNRLSKVVTL